MADKKTWYAISGVNLFHDLVSKTKAVDVFTEDGLQTEYQQLSDYRLSDSTIEAFYNYLVSEFNAINDYFANKHIVEQNPNLYIKNYHGKIKKGKWMRLVMEEDLDISLHLRCVLKMVLISISH